MDAVSQTNYIYTFACHDEEQSLCHLELRSLFGVEPYEGYLMSTLKINASRSPYVKSRVEILYEGASIEEIAGRVKDIQLEGATFKVICIDCTASMDYREQRDAERQIGLHIRGTAEMRKPERLFGAVKLGDRWYFGDYTKNEAVWLQHNNKPQHYSTALSTRVARAIANIAVPHTMGIKAVDPCCGIGTVLVEALSIGIDIVGYDINPLAVRGARLNLAHFQMPAVVSQGNILSLEGDYDVVILDLPYNLCSVLPEDEQLLMLKAARRLSSQAVIITTGEIDSAIELAGFNITERGSVRKGSFVRQIIVCR
ncbi:TRM11 family SAM-dependent methyltransferase [Paenibacillus eucommiae]|uniref:TRM11 family SAM-dependent methyltransferase n=1 Tax=Paenibacillus eucommiae TaxID=1355755 RepID=UPI001AE19DB9|nr:RsmD family RNA methyltransferase [Paenibacillus eucommiae]